MKYFILLLGFCFICFSSTTAQIINKLEAADKHAENLGALTSLNVATITDTLIAPFQSKLEKARAIYYWITHQVALDPKAMRTNDNTKTDPVKVIELRKATPAGFALLFQEMASQADIRCLTVDGYIRNGIDQINEKPDEFNHAWNVIQLGQSPTDWHYVDAARGSGMLDKKQANFIRSFTSEYFFADRRLFNLDHYPDNEAWQLGSGPKGLSDFFSLPVIFPAAYQLGMTSMIPFKGTIKSKVHQSVDFSLRISESASVASIELVIGDESRKAKVMPMNFSRNNGDINFRYTFREEDEIPVTIKADGKEMISYKVIITE